MDNQLDQRRTHTPGHENHGVYVCHKCGWPFPNPHPSAKHRRAHKKICGTIEGYRQTHLNGSDDERVSDDDHKTVKTPGSNALETGNNEKGSDGIGEKLTRSEDDVYSDAVADFSDSGLSPGVKDRLQEVSLDSGTEVEKVNTTEQNLSGSSEHSDFNVEDVSPLIVKSSDDSQIQNPEILPSESVDVGNIVGFQGQLSGSTSDPLTSSVADLGTEELTIVHGDDFSGLSSDSCPSKAEAMPDVLPEKNINAGENVTDSSLICAADQSNLKGKDEIKSEGDMVEFVDSSENIVGETCEGESKIAVSDAVSLDHEVGDEAVIVNPKEKEGPVSWLPQDDLPLELNSFIITNDAQVESAHAIHFATCSDVKVLQEKEEGNVNIDPLPIHEDCPDVAPAHVIHFATCSDVKVLQEKEEGNVNIDPLPIHDDRPDVAHPQSEYGDFKDHEGVVSQNPLSAHSSESLKHKEDVTEENDFHFDTSQLSEKIGILSSDMHVLDSSMKMETEDIHVEDCNEVSPVKPTIDSTYHRSHEIGASMKTEMNENHFSEKQEPDDHKNSQAEGSLMVSSNESQSDASFGSVTGETISVIDIDNTSHHMKNRTEINDVDGKNVGANVENDTEIILKDFQPSDLLLQSEVEQSSGLFKNDAAGEMGKTEQCKELPTERDTSMPKSASFHFESPVIPDVVIDGPARKSNGTECANIDPVPDKNEDEINSNIKPHEESNRSVGTCVDSHEAPGAELLVKAAEDLARKYTSHSSINTEPSVQHDSAVEDNSRGEPQPSGKVSGITAVPVPVQDQSGNNLVKLSSSGIDASVDSGSRCDSLEGNWGSVSVLSMQSDAPAVTDAEILPPTGSLASTEAGKSNSNTPRAAADRQWSRKPEMLEPPSFMTLVESSHAVSPKGAASEVQNPQQPSSTSQAGWFPTLNQVINESQGRKSNEEIIAKVTNWSTSKEHTPLKSLLGEANHSNNKPKSPNMEESSVNQRNGKVPENSGSGLLTTVNSILGPESPADQVAKGEAANEWNSPARYPANIKREKRKFKSRPYWIQLVCCSAVDPRRR